jgi:hypothetical protein
MAVSFCLRRECHSHEVKLAMSTLLQMVIPDAPQNLIGENASDSDRPDAELTFYGIDSLIHISGTEGIRRRMEVG